MWRYLLRADDYALHGDAMRALGTLPSLGFITGKGLPQISLCCPSAVPERT